MENKRILVLHSGGLDSTIMWEMAKQGSNDVVGVYFNIGHDYAWKEIAALPPEIIVHDLTWFVDSPKAKDGNAMGSVFIPGRNMVLIALAASKYLPNEIWLGALMGEIHQYATDKNDLFRDRMTSVLEYALSPYVSGVKVVYPFVEREMGKLEITRWGVEHGMTDKILSSSSCMNGLTDIPCGECGVCLRRFGIFHQLGLSENYAVNPLESLANKQMIKDLLYASVHCDHSHYDEYRIQEIVPALEQIYNKTAEELLHEFQ